MGQLLATGRTLVSRDNEPVAALRLHDRRDDRTGRRAVRRSTIHIPRQISSFGRAITGDDPQCPSSFVNLTPIPGRAAPRPVPSTRRTLTAADRSLPFAPSSSSRARWTWRRAAKPGEVSAQENLCEQQHSYPVLDRLLQDRSMIRIAGQNLSCRIEGLPLCCLPTACNISLYNLSPRRVSVFGVPVSGLRRRSRL